MNHITAFYNILKAYNRISYSISNILRFHYSYPLRWNIV